jgi:hypothetical protein
MGLGVIKVSSKRKERLVSKERLILTFSGEVWYARAGAGYKIRGTGKL